MKAVRENVYTVGPSKSLVAAVTEPVHVAANNATPVIVILNTGIIHRVGHQRKFVMLARELAARGYSVVRFDFSVSATANDGKIICLRWRAAWMIFASSSIGSKSPAGRDAQSS